MPRYMNELVRDRGREQIDIAFAQQWLRQDDSRMKEPDRDWNRQRL